jgi:hypothetical protein
MFKIEFATRNAAFQEGCEEDHSATVSGFAVAEQLHKIAELVAEGGTYGTVRDSNGSTVGSWELDDEADMPWTQR